VPHTGQWSRVCGPATSGWCLAEGRRIGNQRRRTGQVAGKNDTFSLNLLYSCTSGNYFFSPDDEGTI